MTSILVTGGSGFIGQHLVSALAARGMRVRNLDVRPPSFAPAEVEYVNGSVLDPVAVDQALHGVDQVYHLAGLPGMWMPRKDDFHRVNYQGTEVVLTAARKRGVPRFLHCSTESILFRSTSAGTPIPKTCCAARRNAGSLHALEIAGRTPCDASRGIRFSRDHRYADDADRTSRP